MTGEGAWGDPNEKPVGSHVSDPGEPGGWNMIQKTTSAVQDPKTQFWKEYSENSMAAALEQGPKEEAGKVTSERWWGMDQDGGRGTGANGVHLVVRGLVIVGWRVGEEGSMSSVISGFIWSVRPGGYWCLGQDGNPGGGAQGGTWWL